MDDQFYWRTLRQTFASVNDGVKFKAFNLLTTAEVWP